MNWKYVFVGIVRRYLPAQMLFAILKLRGESNVAEEASDTYLAGWQAQLGKHGHSFTNKTVLEVGSGRYARFALQLLSAGAQRVILVDLYAVSLDEPTHRAMLLKDCIRLKLDPTDALARIEVIHGDLTTLSRPQPEQQVDIVISNAVMEHVRDPERIFACCLQWLKAGGITQHLIDLRDHNLQFRYPFEMLTFSEEIWNRWFDLRGGFHLNRWRVPDYVNAIRKAGFVNIDYDVVLQDKEQLQANLSRLNHRYKRMGEDILALLMIYLCGQKN